MSSVDVIVPCYRYAHYLEECVQSVLSQDGVAVRVLILDDESPDDTPEVCARLTRDPRVTARRHVKNQGHIKTYNEGIEWAKSDYLLLLSADDYLLPGSLARAAALMDEHPEVGLVFGQCMEIAEDGRMREATTPAHAGMRESTRVLSGEDFIAMSGVGNIVPTPTAIVRTALQQMLGGYHTELPHTADLEMWLRLAAHSKVGVLRDFQAVYRRHANNMSLGYQKRNFLRDLHQRIAALDFFFEYGGRTRLDMSRTRRGMLSALGREAVQAASGAFNDSELELSREFVDFAIKVDPRIKWTREWARFQMKRAMGPRGWRAVRAAGTGMRQLFAPTKQNAG
jgi:glycosyltransferase involved in cell wall biosynthesis